MCSSLVLREPCRARARALISGRAPRGEVLLQPRGVVDRRACHLEVKECAAALARALARAPALEVEGDAVLAVARLPPHEVLGLG